jgi:hypothetical protein
MTISNSLNVLKNDLLVIDRSISPFHSCMVVACYENEFVLDRFVKLGNNISLFSFAAESEKTDMFLNIGGLLLLLFMIFWPVQTPFDESHC